MNIRKFFNQQYARNFYLANAGIALGVTALSLTGAVLGVGSVVGLLACAGAGTILGATTLKEHLRQRRSDNVYVKGNEVSLKGAQDGYSACKMTNFQHAVLTRSTFRTIRLSDKFKAAKTAGKRKKIEKKLAREERLRQDILATKNITSA